MRLKLTALALLGLSNVASASEITSLFSENLTPPNNKVKSIHRDGFKTTHKKSEDLFLRLVTNPSTVHEAAVYALKNQNAFSGDQLYLFAQMLFEVGQDYPASILLEQIVATKTNNTSPAILLKIAEFLKPYNHILSTEAYSYVTQNPQANGKEKATAKSKYRTPKNQYPRANGKRKQQQKPNWKP